MKFEIYADILFINNMTGNLLVLLSASVLMRVKFKKARIFFASFFGALYSTVLFFTNLPSLTVFILNLIFILVVIKMAFYTKSIRAYFKNAVYFFAANFLIGGCIYGLYSFTGVSKLTKLSNGIAYFNIPTFATFIFFILAVLLVMMISKLNGEVKISSLFINVSVRIAGMTIPLNGFIDTGNMMTDFLTGLPVLIAEAECFRPFFAESTYSKIISGNIEKMTSEEMKNIRLLPANTAFASSSLLVCIRPDYIILKSKSKETRADALIGLTGKKLSLTGEYNMLLSPAVNS